MKPEKRHELTERDIKNLLTSHERPVPPADLAERIKQEIPLDLPAMPGLAEAASQPSTPSRSRIWLMAASVVIAIGGGFIAFRLMEQMPRPDEIAMTQVEPTRGAGDAVQPSVSESKGEAVAPPAEAPVAAAPRAVAPRAVTPADDAAEKEGTPDRAAIGLLQKEEAAKVDRDRALTEEPRLSGALSSQLGEMREQESAAPRPPAASRSPVADPTPPASPGLADSIDVALRSARFQESSTESKQVIAESGDVPVSAATPPPKNKRRVVPPPAPAPPPSPPRGRVPEHSEELRALAEADDTLYNYRIEGGNAHIRRMEREARALEAELQALEIGSPAPPPSTGGTAEPNDAPYGDVFFDSAGTNPFIDTEDDALSTFGLDVDTGSYTVIRRYLRDGHLPPPEAVRVEELINYFDYGDAAPETEEFAIHAEGAPSIYGQGERYHLLRFNLSGRELDDTDRRPALLTFVIDVSGSMSRENRLGLVKQALALLIEQLRADDRLALVIYGSRGQVVLEPTSNHSSIRRAIDGLATGGSTNASEGLELAYELAASHRRRGAINRVILCSDGVANVGATSAGSILERIRREADQGIELTTVGFGMGNYNDTLMEQLADTGNGRYAYVDTLDEARRIFVENLTGTLQTLAAEARVQVEFNPEIVSRYRLLGYENRDIADERFRDDSVDAGEIGVGHKVTALYEIKTERPLRAGDRVGTLRLRYGSVDTGKVIETERVVTGADFASRWDAASPALKLTSLVAEYAEILKRSYWAREGDLDDVFRRAQRLSAEFEGDREVADFVSLVGRAAEYRERETR